MVSLVCVPGFFVGYVPWRYFGLNRVQLDVIDAGHVLGLFCIAFGAVLLGACIFEFARSGRGTLRFPLDEDVPVALVAKLAKLRVQERRRTGVSGKTTKKRRGPSVPRSRSGR